MRTDAVVAAARDWIGTPYRHQASVKGAGADCLGLLRGLWRELYGTEAEHPPVYTEDWGEPRREEVLWRALARHMRQIPPQSAGPGDLVLFRMRDGGIAKHLGILVEGAHHGSFVHAYSGHGVVESALSSPWRRRIVAAFEFPGKET